MEPVPDDDVKGEVVWTSAGVRCCTPELSPGVEPYEALLAGEVDSVTGCLPLRLAERRGVGGEEDIGRNLLLPVGLAAGRMGRDKSKEFMGTEIGGALLRKGR